MRARRSGTFYHWPGNVRELRNVIEVGHHADVGYRSAELEITRASVLGGERAG